MDLKEAVKHNYLLRDLPGDGLDAVVSLATFSEFSGGDVIIREFDKNTDLFILLEGNARINTFGGEKLAEIGPGGIVGEISLIDEQPRSATVVSMGATKAARISSEKLRDLLRQRHDIASALYRNLALVLCTRIRTANLQLDGLMAR